MNKVDKVKYLIELEEEKAQLERKLAIINGKINTQRETCSHVSVDLGYYGLYPSTGDEYCCLLCGMGKNREYYYDPRYMVHAEDYLPQYDIKDDEQCIAKFEHIQTLALGILKENPEMSNEELVSRLNNLIQESISMRQSKDTEMNGPKLVKRKNPNKK